MQFFVIISKLYGVKPMSYFQESVKLFSHSSVTIGLRKWAMNVFNAIRLISMYTSLVHIGIST